MIPDGYRPNVGVMLFNPVGLVFVGRRLDRSGEHWQMPQGGIDPGEEPRAAAGRELAEETGVDKAEIVAETAGWMLYDVPKTVARRLWRGRWRGQAQRWFLMRHLGGDGDIDIATRHPEFAAWKWVAPAETLRLIVPFKREVYGKVVAEFAPKIRAALDHDSRLAPITRGDPALGA